ncbi:DUF2681 domain-containing protein [Mannheimia haemolytica]|uniref:DUF2681 domain-containing protein n=1 Tax=Mannheimia haemolytica TaxID=75985 RepID=UPI0001BCF826|nr:DUF2681 domain-containing protein [Mannheimia haemolytica]EEY12051.1 hypothetical protein COK_1874 [Mannheimia haemolytica serotype A2 str. BOVINE]MDW0723728.1 DUF2681 domain-containing protein [Mannheimia haemolytica]MDW0736793.1 DUF2681 domain-containing protein [Mannheimia haemolytica]TRC15538.1 DUF2681 domain-containing protein [Mannheimia haemolytica]TRC66841.1 DUF2681 domain-containing protein [Mannheimia haemolytica]
MITQQIVGVVGVVSTILAYAFYKSWQLKQERKLTATLKAEKQQQAVEIQQKNAEVKNAKIQQKHVSETRRIQPSAIDEQLHQHGYFRDDNGLHGVRSDLPEPCGHAGNETPSACTQSDL